MVRVRVEGSRGGKVRVEGRKGGGGRRKDRGVSDWEDSREGKVRIRVK
jgi:hypothetical protein